MKAKIYSDRPVKLDTIKKLVDIFRKSNCPNDSMFNSIENFKGFDGRNILLGTGNGFLTVLQINKDTFDATMYKESKGAVILAEGELIT